MRSESRFCLLVGGRSSAIKTWNEFFLFSVSLFSQIHHPRAKHSGGAFEIQIHVYIPQEVSSRHPPAGQNLYWSCVSCILWIHFQFTEFDHPGLKMRILFYLGIFSDFDPSNSLVTSPFFSSLVLGAIRFILALYSLLTVIIHLGVECVEGDSCTQYVWIMTHYLFPSLNTCFVGIF